MQQYSMARSAYAQAAAPVRTDRGTEYDAFARATSGLRTAASEGSFPALAEALHQNTRLWTLMATSVADSANKLPQQLRAQIFYLAEFTQQHTAKVLGGTASPDILVEINTAVMRGLRSQETPA